ncbi:hypothetical protein AAG906_038830 [Vitis piasezkii]
MQKQENQLKLALLAQIPVLSWSQKQPISGSITKEEEEAVETLYTLGELVGESSESKHSTLPEARESPAPALGLFLICY